MRKFIVILLLALITSKQFIRPVENRFEDQIGRQHIFHGVNIVVKNFPYYPSSNGNNFDNIFTDQDIDFLLENGFNSVRLGIIWEAVETDEGVYDEDYLNQIEKLINKLGEVGIYTILDNHQDLFSSLFCGEGAPLFYAVRLQKETSCSQTYFSSFLKLIGQCTELNCHKSFFHNNKSIQYSNVVNLFFSNEAGVLDAFKEYWSFLAKRFKQNRFLIGYEIYNEPFFGLHDFFANIPGYNTNSILSDFYQKINNRLEKEDAEFVMIFEPPMYPDSTPLFGGRYLGGFNKPPGSNAKVLSEHFYCAASSLEALNTFSNSDKYNLSIDLVEKCAPFLERKLNGIKKSAESLGVPVLLTEFGACENNKSCSKEMEMVINKAEELLIGWYYWQYKSFNDHTSQCSYKSNCNQGLFQSSSDNVIEVQEIKIKNLVRPYIQYFQSNEVLISKFNSELKVYESNFIVNTSLNDFSCLFMSSKFYNIKGFKLIIFNHLIEKSEEENEKVGIEAFTSDNKGIKLNLERNVSSKELNEMSLLYVNFKFKTRRKEDTIKKFLVTVILAPAIRYTYNIINEEKAYKLLKFNIKVSDINPPFYTQSNKKLIFYFRNKLIDIPLNQGHFGINHSIGHVLNNEKKEKVKIIFKGKDNKYEIDQETRLNFIICNLNEECIIDYLYLEYVKIVMFENDKDLIEWEFFNLLNHRILINFN